MTADTYTVEAFEHGYWQIVREDVRLFTEATKVFRGLVAQGIEARITWEKTTK
jgi:hypothetical protein